MSTDRRSRDRSDTSSLTLTAVPSHSALEELESSSSPFSHVESATSATMPTHAGDHLPGPWLDELLTLALDAAAPIDLFVNLLNFIARVLPDAQVGGVVHNVDKSTFHTFVQSPLESTFESTTPPGPPFEPSTPTVSIAVDLETIEATFYVSCTDSAIRHAHITALLARVADVFRASCVRIGQLERAQTEVERLRHLEEASAENTKLASLGQFAAGVVHDLSSPLTSIVGYADYLIQKSSLGSQPPDPEDFDRLRRISDSATRMLRFARSVVSYVRPTADTRAFCSVHALLDDALSFCEEELRSVGARVVRDYAPGQVLMRGSPEPLTQAFVNLINNACHAMQPGSAVLRIATRIENSKLVVLTFEDNGSGIPAEHQPRIFAPFFTTKVAGKGTGLGLSIVKRIVEEHAGSVAVESGTSQGTRFVIGLPIDVVTPSPSI